MRFLELCGLLVALIGGGILMAPSVMKQVLRLLGLRLADHPLERAAAWGLVVLGLLAAFIARAVG